MDAISREWIDIAMRTTPIDRSKITTAIHALYASVGKKAPRVVVASSPAQMAFVYGAAAWIWYCREQDKKRTYVATDAATHAATDAATDDATRAATYDATSAA